MAAKGERLYALAAVEGCVSVAAMSISILAKNPWNRRLGKPEIDNKMRGNPIEHSLRTMAYPPSQDARPADSATPLRLHAHTKQ